MSQEAVDDLNKALGTGTSGEAYGGGEFADGSALRPESLEGTLKVVIAKDKHIKFWKDISKKPAYNTVEEFNVLDSYGGDASPFFVEGGLPNEEDSNYVRKTALVKFLGTTRVITHPMTLVRSAHGDVVARESQNGTLWLLQQMERALFFGDSAMNPLAFDGIEAQMIAACAGKEQIIDMKGEPLGENALEDGANVILENYGTPSKMYLTPVAHKDISKTVFSRQRGNLPLGSGRLGAPLNGYDSNAGSFDFEPDVFLRPRGAAPTSAPDGAPVKPTWAASDAITAGTSSTGVGLKAGTYKYVITAVNDKGESVASAEKSAAATLNQSITLVFNRQTDAPAPRSYRIYRDNADGNILFMTEIAQPSEGDTVTYEDRNQDIPGTSKAFLLDLDSDQSLAFKQLAPLMKLPLARISASERFMILLYGMPLIYNPKRNVIFKNVGKYTE
jgi:hypothetical protein